MKSKNFILVANWKMNKTLLESEQFFIQYKIELDKLSKEVKLIFLPSFVALRPIFDHLNNSTLFIGAQDCSIHDKGAFTGQVDAISLQEAGCSYVLVGHNERRMYQHETKKEFLLKMQYSLQAVLIPIFCIGEQIKEKSINNTLAILYNQLSVLIELRQKNSSLLKQLIIAYEPGWAIGTESGLDSANLQTIIDTIKNYLASILPGISIRLLYGGGITPQQTEKLIQIQELDGFLLGKASLDFQNLQNIVSLVTYYRSYRS